MDKKLLELRNKIDKVDDEIAKLYVERMSLAKEVGLAKRESGVATENALREKEIVNRVTDNMDESLKLYAKQVFNALFDTSKAYQSSFVDVKSSVKTEIEEALLSGVKPFPSSASVACQGVEGAYASIAVEKAFA